MVTTVIDLRCLHSTRLALCYQTSEWLSAENTPKYFGPLNTLKIVSMCVCMKCQIKHLHNIPVVEE